MSRTFKDRGVIVSGAAHGLGHSTALAFAESGARVFACDIAAGEFSGPKANRIDYAVIDLTDEVAVTHWLRDIEARFTPGIDILVNNAGGPGQAQRQPLESVSSADWDSVIARNVTTTFKLSRAVVPGMKRRENGRIINISSGAGIRASRTAAIHAYTSAKHAIVGLTRQMAFELGPHGITVNSVAPGLVLTTPEVHSYWKALDSRQQNAVIESINMRRLGQPEDVVEAILFLASDAASWISGQVLAVDGGIT